MDFPLNNDGLYTSNLRHQNEGAPMLAIFEPIFTHYAVDAVATGHIHVRFYIENEEFCIKNEKTCIKNDESCIIKEELCI